MVLRQEEMSVRPCRRPFSTALIQTSEWELDMAKWLRLWEVLGISALHGLPEPTIWQLVKITWQGRSKQVRGSPEHNVVVILSKARTLRNTTETRYPNYVKLFCNNVQSHDFIKTFFQISFFRWLKLPFKQNVSKVCFKFTYRFWWFNGPREIVVLYSDR